MHGFETRYVSGLAVLEKTADERGVQRELQTLDRRLFLDREYDSARGLFFYTVKVSNGDRPPDLVLDWRDPDDRPRQLSSGVANEVRRMIAQGPVDIRELARRNEQAKERRRVEARAAYTEVAREFERKDNPAHSPVLQRGQHLRRARERARSRGQRLI